MRKSNFSFAWAFLFLVGSNLSAASPASDETLTPVSRADLCVTEGAIAEMSGHRLSVSVPKMRAYLDAITPQAVEVHFKYLGATGNEARLGSGELRRQFGLKSRTLDAVASDVPLIDARLDASAPAQDAQGAAAPARQALEILLHRPG